MALPWPAISGRGRSQPDSAEVPAPTGNGCWKTDLLGSEAELERGSVALSFHFSLFIRVFYLLCLGEGGGLFLPVGFFSFLKRPHLGVRDVSHCSGF